MPIADHIKKDSPTNNFATAVPAANITLSDGNLKCAATQAEWDGVASSISVKSGKYYYEYLVVHSGDLNRIMMGLANLTAEYTKHFDGKGDSGDPASVISDNPLWVKMTWTNYHANTTTYTGDSTAVANDDILGIFFDLDSSTPTIKYYHNGTLKQSFDLVADKFYTPIALLYKNSSSSNAVIFNFGQDSSFGGNKTGSADATDSGGIGDFYYKPVNTGTYDSNNETNVVSDFRALCTANLPDFTPNVDDDNPENYFKCVTWIGDNAGQRAIPHNMSTTPDLVWIKNRSDGGYGHTIFDSVRGYGTNEIQSSGTSAQGAYSGSYGYVASVGDTYINVTDGGAAGFADRKYTNYSGDDYVSWCWKAGGAPAADNTATSGAMTANSVSVDGTLQSSYTPNGSPTIYPTRMSVNTKAGFSIIKYNGSGTSDDVNYSIPHGLATTPSVVIVKNLDLGSQSSGISWPTLFTNIGGMPGLDGYWDKDNIVGGSTANSELTHNWGGSYPNSNVFYVRRPSVSSTTNRYRTMGNYNYIAYIWTEIAGFSKFGSYSPVVGDTFVFTDFKPAWLMVKQAFGGTINDYSSWTIIDNARDTFNVCNTPLYANRSKAEAYRAGDSNSIGNNADIDFLSNGFKVFDRDSGETSAPNATYVYMAFAEQPTKFANAR